MSPPPPLSMQGLQALLREDKARTQARRDAQATFAAQTRIRQGLDKPWRNKSHRPLVPTLYKCRLSTPQTTLVHYPSLPKQVQDKLHNNDDENETKTTRLAQDDPTTMPAMVVVEVPLTHLVSPANQEEHAGSALQHRPLGGNLTTKLSEYTRGAVGASRPFRPGGLGADDDDDEKVERAFCTPAHVAQVQAVLHEGSETSWHKGTLLTAPPGVDFAVGLSWTDLHSNAQVPFETQEAIDATDVSAEMAQAGTNEDVAAAASPFVPSQRAPATGGMFNKAFFEDDSLFGSSSSESDDDSEDDSHKDEEDEAASKEEPAVSSPSDDLSDSPPVTSGDHQTEKAEEDVAMDEAEVDRLLAELSATDRNAPTKKVVGTTNTNPLELATQQAQDQNNTTRKSWASTQLLPIRDFSSYIPNPAITYPFALDGFQQQAVARLERSESVFVAAHTSAGKTVCAEYAIALAKQRATRCVYTSPIKALSNQKFRDFSKKFGSQHVGLVTGDLQVNVDDSTVLIMTTEILRSMLYRGADMIRDIEFCIFDEVHYVNDQERGVVWEEVIIMLPSYVTLVFLSATTPNTLEFSDWIGRTKRKPVYVVKTNYRPVPLSHFLWAGSKLHKILEGNGSLLEKGYAEATNALRPASKKKTEKGKPLVARSATGSKDSAWQTQGSKNNWMSLIRFLDRELLTPTVVFLFSKKKCEEIAGMLSSLDLNTAKERSAIQGFTIQTVARLSANDAGLPQVQLISEMVQRGIGVHHGGLLPILKEMVEILFSRNLIKVLFATETFAMGVNMPARSVVMSAGGIRKHDGTQFRFLEAGEYTQMAGRAGRRGLDKVGTVIIGCFGETPPPQPILRQMLTGSSTRLRSQFRLTYNMILNLLRVEEMSVESMIKRSFSEFATQRALAANDFPKLLSRGLRTLAKLEEQFQEDDNARVGAEDIEDYFLVSKQLLSSHWEILSHIRDNENESFVSLLQPGRIVLVNAARAFGVVRAPALVLRASNGAGAAVGVVDKAKCHDMVCLVLLPPSFVNESKGIAKPPGTIGSIGSASQRHYAIQEFNLDQILLVSSQKHKVDVGAVLKNEGPGHRLQSHPGMAPDPFFKSASPFAGMKSLSKKGDNIGKSGSSSANDGKAVDLLVSKLLEVERVELEGGMEVLDLRAFLKRGSDVVEFRKLCDNLDLLAGQLRSFATHRHPNLERHYATVERKETLRSKVETLRHLLSNESLELFPDFLQRKDVLRDLGYLDSSETVGLKGRVACEVNTCEELIATEMVFEGILNDLAPEEIVAVLSALVFQEKRNEDLDIELPEKLVNVCEQMKAIATNLGQLQKENGLNIDPGEYADESLKFGLVHVVYEWALGVPFKNICELTDVQEGSIVRCITRLDELCREIRNCARVVGNPTLYRKLEAASSSIKRDIVFASSLYVS